MHPFSTLWHTPRKDPSNQLQIFLVYWAQFVLFIEILIILFEHVNYMFSEVILNPVRSFGLCELEIVFVF